MAAISSMKRESARRSRPPPATGASSFQFPRPAGAAVPLPPSASPRTRHFSQGPDETTTDSIAARMLAEDPEVRLLCDAGSMAFGADSVESRKALSLMLSP